jgi:hypothetical protein
MSIVIILEQYLDVKGSHFKPHVLARAEEGMGGYIDCPQIKTATRRPPLPICAMVLALPTHPTPEHSIIL